MVQIAPLNRSHLPQVLALVNSHLSTVIPGWSLTADYFWERLQSEPQEYITDPWVVERKSIIGIVKESRLRGGAFPPIRRRHALEGSWRHWLDLVLARRARSWRGGYDGVSAADERLAGGG